MEAVRSSETSVDNHFTRQYNPEDGSEQQKGKLLIDTFNVICLLKNSLIILRLLFNE
jgi:hypothetical protein